MGEAEAKLQRETPPGGSRVETLRKLFEGDASSKMKVDLEEDDTGSSGYSGPTAYRRRRGKGKTPERQGWYNTVRVMYCIVPIQYCNVMYCISNVSGKVLLAHRSSVPLLCSYSPLVYTLQLLAISMTCLS